MKAIVPVDNSENALRIFTTVRQLLALQPEIEVHLLAVNDPKSVHGRQDHSVGEPPAASAGKTTVISPLPRLVESHGEALDRQATEARVWLHSLAEKELPGSLCFPHVVWSAHPAEAIVALGNELEADLTVMASHGRSGVAHLVSGSVTETVIRTSPRPVLVQGPAAV
jgi:nucleotide-binding universal stress UspA family protein